MSPERQGKQMGAVGERDAVLAFRALGMRVITAATTEEVTAALHRMYTEDIPVVFITESCARLAPEALSRYKTMPEMAVIPIPGATGSTGFGLERVRSNVEKAIGANILLSE